MNPKSTLTKLAAHPIFPKVKIVHQRIPALVASSEDMGTVIINAAVPTTINVNGKRVPTAAPLAVYELYSRAGMEVLRDAAKAANHQADEQDIETVARRDVGELAEKHFLTEHYGFDDTDWKVYCDIMLNGAKRKMFAGGPVGDLYKKHNQRDEEEAPDMTPENHYPLPEEKEERPDQRGYGDDRIDRFPDEIKRSDEDQET